VTEGEEIESEAFGLEEDGDAAGDIPESSVGQEIEPRDDGEL
jgi:hypothetical protein